MLCERAVHLNDLFYIFGWWYLYTQSPPYKYAFFAPLLIVLLQSIITKGPFKYYVITFFTFLGPLTHLFDDFAKSSPYFWLAPHRSKVRWRFLKIMWPSHNIWILPLTSKGCEETKIEPSKFQYMLLWLTYGGLKLNWSEWQMRSQRKCTGLVVGIRLQMRWKFKVFEIKQG